MLSQPSEFSQNVKIASMYLLQIQYIGADSCKMPLILYILPKFYVVERGFANTYLFNNERKGQDYG